MLLARIIPALPLAAIAALSAGAATGQPYRWVDENGVTVYSQTPPPGVAERVDIAPGPGAGETEAARQRLRRQIEQDFDQRGDAAKVAEAEDKMAAAAKQRADACAAARQNLDTLENLGARMLRMPDGTVRRPGEQERLRMMDEARGQIGDACD